MQGCLCNLTICMQHNSMAIELFVLIDRSTTIASIIIYCILYTVNMKNQMQYYTNTILI